jgi:hypothetical protein
MVLYICMPGHVPRLSFAGKNYYSSGIISSAAVPGDPDNVGGAVVHHILDQSVGDMVRYKSLIAILARIGFVIMLIPFSHGFFKELIPYVRMITLPPHEIRTNDISSIRTSGH